MKVVACAGRLQTRLEDRPVPSPGAGELLVRLLACGLCGTDLFKLATDSVPRGMVLGHEVVGTIVSLDRDVEGFAVGDRIAVPHHVSCGRCACCRRGSETMCADFRENLLEPGGFSEFFLVRGRAVTQAARALPSHLSDERALFLEPAACVLRGIRRSGLEAGGTAAVLGAGSMGLLHLLVLKAAIDSVDVFCIDPLEDRQQLAMSLGAAISVRPSAATQAVLDSTGGIGADVVFDTVGGAGALSSGLDLSRKGGTVVLFAHASAGETAHLDLNRLFKEERRVVATYSGALAEQVVVHDLLVSGRLDPQPLVTDRLPLSRFEEGVEKVRSHQALKVVYYPA